MRIFFSLTKFGQFYLQAKLIKETLCEAKMSIFRKKLSDKILLLLRYVNIKRSCKKGFFFLKVTAIRL